MLNLCIYVQVGKAAVFCGVIHCSAIYDVKAHRDFRFQLTKCLKKLYR